MLWGPPSPCASVRRRQTSSSGRQRALSPPPADCCPMFAVWTTQGLHTPTHTHTPTPTHTPTHTYTHILSPPHKVCRSAADPPFNMPWGVLRCASWALRPRSARSLVHATNIDYPHGSGPNHHEMRALHTFAVWPPYRASRPRCGRSAALGTRWRSSSPSTSSTLRRSPPSAYCLLLPAAAATAYCCCAATACRCVLCCLPPPSTYCLLLPLLPAVLPTTYRCLLLLLPACCALLLLLPPHSSHPGGTSRQVEVFHLEPVFLTLTEDQVRAWTSMETLSMS